MSKDDTFMKPVMRGKRFEEHSIPVDVLPELPVYQEFVIALAKKIFLQEHPNRQRVPKGFSDRLELRVRDIEDNCATPVLQRKKVQQELVDVPDEFDRARDLINASIDAISRDEPLPEAFPTDMLRYFTRLGQKLRDDESMEFVIPGQGDGPVYNIKTRKRLVALTGEDYRQTVTVEGTVRGSDLDSGRFTLELADGQRVTVSLQFWQEPDILDALRFHRSRSVRVTGIGVYSPHDQLKHVEQIQELDVEDKGPDTEARISHLAALEGGWLDGDGEAISSDVAEAVRDGVGSMVEAQNLPFPYIYPTLAGGLRFEWDFGEWDVEAEFCPDGSLEAHAFQVETDEESTAVSDWREDDWPSVLSEFVAHFIEEVER